jgi:hypothetical protein
MQLVAFAVGAIKDKLPGAMAIATSPRAPAAPLSGFFAVRP